MRTFFLASDPLPKRKGWIVGHEADGYTFAFSRRDARSMAHARHETTGLAVGAWKLTSGESTKFISTVGELVTRRDARFVINESQNAEAF